MRTKIVGLVACALLVVTAFMAASASAATEFGDSCVANETTEASVQATLFALTAAGDPLPLRAPSAGVITKWKINSNTPAPQTLKVLRQTGPESVLVTGESAQNVVGGSNSFDTRISVQAGDRLGLSAGGEMPLLYCSVPGPENLLGVFAGASVGSSATFEEIEAEARVPVSALIEADADNDGYGDETQDKCPQNAAFQAACPVISLSASAIARKGLATVLITSSSQAPVTVTGTVKLGKGKSASLNGGTQVVAPGTIAKFTLLFPEALKAKLKQLSRKRFLFLNLTATAPNVAGAPTTSSLKVKLKGQAKPKRKHRPKPKAQA
jgi:hypothetical protein